MTADDPLTGTEILHWLNSGAPGGWSWPMGMDPWELVEKLAAGLNAVQGECDRWHARVHTFVTPDGKGLTVPGPTSRITEAGGYEFGYTTEADLLAMGCTRLREGNATKIEKAIATALRVDT